MSLFAKTRFTNKSQFQTAWRAQTRDVFNINNPSMKSTGPAPVFPVFPFS